MTRPFGHERLIVYQKGMRFVALRRDLLDRVARRVAALITMHRTAASRVSEDSAQYRTRRGNLFDHEDLDVYQTALRIIGWLDSMLSQCSCSSDLRAKLDRSTTSIVLNIAEGNGRFTGADQATFYDTAYKSTLQSAALIDLAARGNGSHEVIGIEEGREWLRRVATMPTALSKAVTLN